MSCSRSTTPLSWPKAALFILAAAACFHLAYWPSNFGALHFAIFGYVICLVQLARLKTTRQSFYAGLIAALLCVVPQLMCFWTIFGPAAIALWAILALWIAAFTGMAHATLQKFGAKWTAIPIPFIWMGLEYFRSELYYLRFSWMNVGYAFSDWPAVPYHVFGMYGVGFFAAFCGALFFVLRPLRALFLIILLFIASAIEPATSRYHSPHPIHIAGVQMEFPNEREIPTALDSLLAKHPDADLLVLSEYTLDGPVPDWLEAWCRNHRRYVVVGGKDPAPNNNYYNTAFVVSPDGEIVFRQVKSVPIQFFKDGLPAPEQQVWNSPWGKIGFCICYDLSYTRVIDRLVKKGAQLLIVPTMDVVDWGERQHQLHALVAPVRAAEYQIPIFRLASSGISQAVECDGQVLATAPFAGEDKDLYAAMSPAPHPSLPFDRFLAPIAVGITGVLLLVLCFYKPRSKSTAGEKISEATAQPQLADEGIRTTAP